MTITVSFADLTHTGKGIAADYMPLAIACVASYLKKEMGDAVEVPLFKYPTDFAEWLESGKVPQIAAFTNYSWCEHLNYEFARRIKARHPQVVVVFGGPNYPADLAEQADFLRERPDIDFYVDGEGEVAFVELVRALQAVDFDAARLKSAGTQVANTRYLRDNQLIAGEMLPRLTELDDVPSPFLSGMMDKFFDRYLTPLMQTSRGCPYSCTFCHDGISYMSKLKRYSMERITAEIRYIQDRRQVPNLGIADLNFGIFAEDEDVAEFLAGIREECGWPSYLSLSTAKSNKDRVVRMTRRLKGALTLGASVQSTDPEVLALIKRKNIPVDALAAMTLEVSDESTTSLSEIILALPGDTEERHIRSVLDMIDVGIQEIRLFQFIILPGSDGASRVSREKFGYVGRWRLPPLAMGRYSLYGQEFGAAEIHEVCVGNDTMPHDAYLQCRKFDLVVSIFNNGGIFNELYSFMETRGIKRSRLLHRVWEDISRQSELFRHLFDLMIADEEANFWADRDAFLGELAKPEFLDRYIKGDLGTNQMLHFRAVALAEHFDEVCSLIFGAANLLLGDAGDLGPEVGRYLAELNTVVRLRKGNLLDTTVTAINDFHYDFVKLAEHGFRDDPFAHLMPDGVRLKIAHSTAQRRDIDKYAEVYGRSVDGLERFFNRTMMRGLYRELVYVA